MPLISFEAGSLPSLLPVVLQQIVKIITSASDSVNLDGDWQSVIVIGGPPARPAPRPPPPAPGRRRTGRGPSPETPFAAAAPRAEPSPVRSGRSRVGRLELVWRRRPARPA